MGCFLFHSWSKWEQYEILGTFTSVLFRYESGPSVIHMQKRHCLKCGKEQREEI